MEKEQEKKIKLSNTEIEKVYKVLININKTEKKTTSITNHEDITQIAIHAIIKNGIPEKVYNRVFSSSRKSKIEIRNYLYTAYFNHKKNEHIRTGRLSATFESYDNKEELKNIASKKQLKTLHNKAQLHKYIIKEINKNFIEYLDLRTINIKLVKQCYSFHFIKSYPAVKISKITNHQVLKVRKYIRLIKQFIKMLNLTTRFNLNNLLQDAVIIDYNAPVLQLKNNSKFIDRLVKNGDGVAKNKTEKHIKELFEKIHKTHENKHLKAIQNEKKIKDSITFKGDLLSHEFNLNWSYEISKKLKEKEANGKVIKVSVNKYLQELKEQKVSKELIFNGENFNSTMIKSQFAAYTMYGF